MSLKRPDDKLRASYTTIRTTGCCELFTSLLQMLVTGAYDAAASQVIRSSTLPVTFALEARNPRHVHEKSSYQAMLNAVLT